MLTPEEHRKQTELYHERVGDYRTYAETLGRILREACAASFPEALVQSRAKSESSFAEKAVRKSAVYADAVNQFTDLCAARVIVQTAEQVKAVRIFIEANFTVLDQEDKGLALGKDVFGYRDMHYVVQLPPEKDAALGISARERAAIGDHKAEIQVRTWLQHAWADTFHDRIYKTKLGLSDEVFRTNALVAALLEAGDRTMNQLADELDEMIANYTAFAKKEQVESEIAIQRLIYDNEPSPEKKPGLALGLARLIAATGDYNEVVQLLRGYSDIRSADRCDVLLHLGESLCQLHRGAPASAEYAGGLDCLKEALALCEDREAPYARPLRRRASLHARVLARLAWALEAVPGEECQAKERHHQAHECQSDNPYYLAQMLGYDMFISRSEGLPDSMRTTIRTAIRTCRQHALAGIELPSALFTAGRLSLLVKEGYDALGFYARGIRHVLAGVYCTPRDALADEISWLMRVHFGAKIPRPSQQVIDLLKLAQSIAAGRRADRPPSAKIAPPVLIITGGAASIDAAGIARAGPLLQAALAEFPGTAISGGTAVGVPGCAGDVAAQLLEAGQKRFRLLGYLPVNLPWDAPLHPGYDQQVKCGDGFQPDQVLGTWLDIHSGGIAPEDVLLLGIGGGQLSAVEYHIALGLGAAVGVIEGSGGAVQTLLDDPLWSRLPNLVPLPADATTVRAFAMSTVQRDGRVPLEPLARSLHEHYVASRQGKLPGKMRSWESLEDTFRRANMEEAKDLIKILEAGGFGVRELGSGSASFAGFSDDEVQRLAELEHGRWNVERIRAGWRCGKVRDDAKKIHNCIVAWSDLPEEIKSYDREAVRAFPAILASVNMEVFRHEPLARQP